MARRPLPDQCMERPSARCETSSLKPPDTLLGYGVTAPCQYLAVYHMCAYLAALLKYDLYKVYVLSLPCDPFAMGYVTPHSPC